MLQDAGIDCVTSSACCTQTITCSHTKVARLTKFLQGYRLNALLPPQGAAHAPGWQAGAGGRALLQVLQHDVDVADLAASRPPGRRRWLPLRQPQSQLSSHTPRYWLA